ncbi:Putative epoxide hydrolase [Cladobotryum mycophilum]|uniref:Epoxide hydrolase n=1 Tax=Cladobotryum mycophilum TaxID=491253 RepID=A0ABR0SLL2_9HYPO
MPAEIRPFKVEVPDATIQRLKDKLALTTWPDEVGFSDDWNFGAPLSDVKRLAEYWRNGFDWRAQEAKINQLPQFKTTVSVDGFDDLDMHFVYQKSSRKDAIPLLFVHGWPGHFLEVAKILPLLTEPKDGPAFHVVAPSLPNFGFSGLVSKKGFSIPQYAEAVHKVMLNLGYEKYATQGGDWGFFITRMVGILYPDNCIASHINFFFTTDISAQDANRPLAGFEKDGIERSKWFKKEGSGYSAEQGTKPSTLGFSLSDSPVGLLAWIYEKLRDWTDNYPWTDDEILAWISIYQFSSAGPAASVRIYYENSHTELEKNKQIAEHVPKVPLGLSQFPRDLALQPMYLVQNLGPIVFEKVHSEGGHFAAYERPELLVEDVREMFASDALSHLKARI